jgi:pimeloyl-ACP methyl ester carboxylesterase
MGSTPRWLFARTVRRGCAHPEVFTDARVRSLWAQFDQGTQRALLRLHRSLDERLLGAMAARLDALRMPVLILWGEQDPWFSVEFAEGYARRVPGATVERVSDAGHWPWLERDDVADRIAEFVTG